MSWENCTPKREPDGVIQKSFIATHGDHLKKKVMIWIKEDRMVEFQAMQSRKEGWDCIQVSDGIKYSHYFECNEWDNFITETILLGDN